MLGRGAATRWGRAQETFGEDPELMSRLVVQFVRGAQQDATPDGGDGALQVGMCCKHAAAYSVEDRPIQRYQFNATVDARELWESYLPAFRACALEAGATHVMCSYAHRSRTRAPLPSLCEHLLAWLYSSTVWVTLPHMAGTIRSTACRRAPTAGC